MKYTIQDFNRQFPNDEACLEHLFQWRYGKTYACPKCQKKGTFHKLTNRKCYACAHCAYHFYPTAGTIFHKSSTPLLSWFYCIFVMSQSKNGVAAKEIERKINVCYRTAWRMARQIKKLMTDDCPMLSGTVEADETYIGGADKNRQLSKRRHKTGMDDKIPVLGLLEREGKIVVTRVLKRAYGKEIKPIVKSKITKDSVLISDGFGAYHGLNRHFKRHEVVDHHRQEYVRGKTHTNTIEGFWSQMKRSIDGTYHSVSGKYLSYYVNEFAFRYNYRASEKHLFAVLLEKL